MSDRSAQFGPSAIRLTHADDPSVVRVCTAPSQFLSHHHPLPGGVPSQDL